MAEGPGVWNCLIGCSTTLNLKNTQQGLLQQLQLPRQLLPQLRPQGKLSPRHGLLRPHRTYSHLQLAAHPYMKMIASMS